jgi:hypothetical protein
MGRPSDVVRRCNLSKMLADGKDTMQDRIPNRIIPVSCFPGNKMPPGSKCKASKPKPELRHHEGHQHSDCKTVLAQIERTNEIQMLP